MRDERVNIDAAIDGVAESLTRHTPAPSLRETVRGRIEGSTQPRRGGLYAAAALAGIALVAIAWWETNRDAVERVLTPTRVVEAPSPPAVGLALSPLDVAQGAPEPAEGSGSRVEPDRVRPTAPRPGGDIRPAAQVASVGANEQEMWQEFIAFASRGPILIEVTTSARSVMPIESVRIAPVEVPAVVFEQP